MIQYPKTYAIPLSLRHKDWLIAKAHEAMTAALPHITDVHAPQSQGGIHDYYSNGDYWWPDPATPDGLPYIRRDGETNPDNFDLHRQILRAMGTYVVHLACGWLLTGRQDFAGQAVRLLKEFFLDEETRMNPSLDFAQAIPGVCPGRGIGIIDTIHLADIPFAITALESSNAMTAQIKSGLTDWFSQYLTWLFSSPNGIAEKNTTNNHCICFYMQSAAFALFTHEESILRLCRQEFKTSLLGQMNPDGSFPQELARTKPYNYSIFAADNLVSLCHMLSTPEDDLWEYETEKGQGIRQAVRFLTPYLLDKSSWPYKPDIMHFDVFPARISFMAFAGCRYGIPELVELYDRLPPESPNEEARRNAAVREPMLWM